MIDSEWKPVDAEASGALSRITDETVRGALKLPKAGQVYDLGLELNSRIPHNAEFVRFAMAFTHTPEGTGARSPFQYSVKSIKGALHIGTHIDALIHVQQDGRYSWRPNLASKSRNDRGWIKHGIETVPPIIGRAISLDIPGLKNVGRLEDCYEVTVDDIRRASFNARGARDQVRRHRSRPHRQDPGLRRRSRLPGCGARGRAQGGDLALRTGNVGAWDGHHRNRAVAFMIRASPRMARCSSKRVCAGSKTSTLRRSRGIARPRASLSLCR